MKVDEFIRQLQNLKPELRDKEIVIEAPNGLLFPPQVKQLKGVKDGIFGETEKMIIKY